MVDSPSVLIGEETNADSKAYKSEGVLNTAPKEGNAVCLFVIQTSDSFLTGTGNVCNKWNTKNKAINKRDSKGTCLRQK